MPVFDLRDFCKITQGGSTGSFFIIQRDEKGLDLPCEQYLYISGVVLAPVVTNQRYFDKIDSITSMESLLQKMPVETKARAISVEGGNILLVPSMLTTYFVTRQDLCKRIKEETFLFAH